MSETIKTYNVDVSRTYFKSYQGRINATSASQAIDIGIDCAQDSNFEGGTDRGTSVNINDANDYAEVDEDPTPELTRHEQIKAYAIVGAIDVAQARGVFTPFYDYIVTTDGSNEYFDDPKEAAIYYWQSLPANSTLHVRAYSDESKDEKSFLCEYIAAEMKVASL